VELDNLYIGSDEINNCAFYGCSNVVVVSLRDPLATTNDTGNTLELLGNKVFYNCSAIEEIHLSGTFNQSGTEVFNNCSSVHNVYYYNTIQNWWYVQQGEQASVFQSSVGTFYSLDANNEWVIETEVTSPSDYNIVGNVQFDGFEQLTFVTLTSNITTIMYGAFYGCIGLTEFTVPENVTSIGNQAFNKCTNIEYFYFNAKNCANFTGNQHMAFKLMGSTAPNGVTVNVGEFVSRIPDNMFNSTDDPATNPNITKIDFTGSLCFYIGNRAFEYIDTIEEVYFSLATGMDGQIMGVAFNNNSTPTIYYENDQAYWQEKVVDYNYNLYGNNTEQSYSYYNKMLTNGTWVWNDDYWSINLRYNTTYGCYEIYDTCATLTGDLRLPSVWADGNTAHGTTGFRDWARVKRIADGTTNITGVFYGHRNGITGHIYIPRAIEYIGKYAFANCEKATGITIPETVTSIGNNAFYDTKAVQEIHFDAIACNSLPARAGINSNDVFYDTGSSSGSVTLYVGREVTRIPAYMFDSAYSVNSNNARLTNVVFEGDRVKSIGAYAFYQNGYLPAITIPDSVETIGSYAFKQNDDLTTITLGKNLQSIGTSAFEACDKLTTVYYNNDMDEWFHVSLADAKANPMSARYLDSKYDAKFYEVRDENSTDPSVRFDTPTHITTPEDVTSINSYLFYGFTQILDFTIGSHINQINTSAFIGLVNLDYVYYDASIDRWWTVLLVSAGSNPFYSAPNDARFYTRDGGENSYTAITHLQSRNISYAGSYQFYSMDQFTKITLHDNLETINTSAFAYMNGVTEITLGSGLLRSYDNAFSGTVDNGVLTKVTYNNSINEWWHISFSTGASNPMYTSSGNYKTFYTTDAASPVTSLTSPTDVTQVNNYAFHSFKQLTSITLTSNITTIGQHAFYNCEEVTSITVDDALTSISTDAFHNCMMVQEFNYDGVMDSWWKVSLSNVGSHPFNSADTPGMSTRDASGAWVTLSSITSPADITSVGYAQFYNSTQFEHVTLTSNVTSIGNYAFYENDHLMEIVIPNSVTSIGAYAFHSCSAATTLTIGTGVTSIGDYAFYNTTGLLEINYNAVNVSAKSSYNYVFNSAGSNGYGITLNIGFSVNNIPKYLFNPCNSTSYNPKIENIDFTGSACSTINDYAFAYCNEIYNIYFTSAMTTINSNAFAETLVTKVIYYENSETYRANNLTISSTGNNYITPGNTYAIWYYNTDNNMNDLGFEYRTDHYEVYSTGHSVSGQLRIPSVWYDSTNGWAQVTTTRRETAGSDGNYDGFNKCDSLTSVIIPKTFTSLGYDAFYSCDELTTVYLSKNIQTLENYSLGSCSKLTTVYYDNSMENWWKVNISSDSAAPLRGAGEYATHFYTRDGAENTYTVLSSITSPSDITAVGQYQFYGFTQLTGSVTISSSVTTIGKYSFYNCYNIDELQFKSLANLNSIGNSAFYNCENITGIYAEDSINGWWSVSLGDSYSNPMYEAKGTAQFWTTESAGDDYQVVTAISNPSSVTAVGQYQFYNFRWLTSVTLSDDVTLIGNSAFYNNTSLATLYLGNKLTSISSYAFYGTSELENVYYNAPIASWWNVELHTISSNPMYATVNTSILSETTARFHTIESGSSYTVATSISSPSGMTRVIEYQFYGFTQLDEIVVNDDVTHIFSGAFAYTGVETLTLSGNLSYIYTDAFLGTPYIHDVYYHATIDSWWGVSLSDIDANPMYSTDIDTEFYSLDASGAYTIVRDLVIPSSRTAVNNYSFACFYQLESLNLGNKITSIGIYAFYECIGIEGDIVIPNTVITVYTHAFEYCNSVEKLTIGTGVTTIGNDAFCYMESLVEINYNAINAGNKSADNYVFEGAGYNTDGIVLSIGPSVTRIPNYLFYPCSSHHFNLSVIDFTGSICSSIGDYAFADCDWILTILFTSALTYIGSNAFDNDSQPNVYYENTDDYYASNVQEENGNYGIWTAHGAIWYYMGDGQASTLTFYYESGNYCVSGSAYTSGDFRVPSVWNDGTNGWAQVTEISDYAFEDAIGLYSINIPKTITSIGSYAFSGCDGMVAVKIGENVNVIDTDAFAGCSSLATVYYNAPIEQWWYVELVSQDSHPFSDYGVYDGTTSFYTLDGARTSGGINYALITDITSPQGMTVLGNYQFYRTTQLTDVTIRDEVTTIGNSMFVYCKNISTLTIGSGVTYIGTAPFTFAQFQSVYYNASIDKWWTVELHTVGSNPLNNSGAKSDAKFYTRDGSGGAYTAVTELVSPSGVTSTGFVQFAGFNQLTSVTLNEGFLTIGNSSFENCENLVTVNLPSTLETIDSSAFQKCKSLANVTIPNSVTTIGSYAFGYCSSLTTIALSDNLTTVESRAFSGCSGLTTIDLGDNSATFENYVFYNCSSLTSVDFGSGSKVFGYSTFEDCTSLETINITGVTTFGNYTFDGCTKLKNVTIGDSVTTMGTYTFNGCSALETVVLGDGLTTISRYTFKGCSKLKTLTIGSNITSIDTDNFTDCTAITDVYYKNSIDEWWNLSLSALSKHPFYKSTSATLHTLDANDEWTVVTELTNPSDVTAVGTYQFYNMSQFTSVTLTDSITSIGSSSFYGSAGIQTLTIGKNVTTISSSAFYNTYGITQINYNAINANNLNSYNNNVFINTGKNGTGVTIKVGAEVTRIPNYLFNPKNSTVSNDFKLKVIDFRGSICSTIGQYAFAYKNTVTEIYFTMNITTIGNKAFYAVSNLGGKVDIYYEGSAAMRDSLITFGTDNSGVTDEENVCVWHYLENVDNLAFTYDSSLDGYVVAGATGFSGALDIPEYWNDGTNGYKQVKAIADRAFYSYPGISSVNIPNTVTTIGSEAFRYCSGMTTITIPGSVTQIGADAFMYCSGLTSVYYDAPMDSWWYVDLASDASSPLYSNSAMFYTRDENGVYCIVTELVSPAGLTFVGKHQFYKFNQLTTVTLSDSIQEVRNRAFRYCSNIATLNIGANVYWFEEGAFYGVDNITNIYYNNSLESWLGIAFIDAYSNPNFEAEDSNFYLKQNGSYTMQTGALVVPAGTTAIGPYVFAGFDCYTSIDIPDSVTSIGAGAFVACDEATTLTIGANVASIGASAFNRCTKIEVIFYNNRISSWWNIDFENVTSNPMASAKSGTELLSYNESGDYVLETTITSPSGAETIKPYLFYKFKQITTVNIDGAVKNIGESVFYSCTGVTDVYYYNTIDMWWGVILANVSSNPMASAADDAEFHTLTATLNPADGWLVPTEITSPSGLYDIGTAQFVGFKQLISVNIAAEVLSIGDYAFADCYSLVDMPFLTRQGGNFTVEEIGDFAFEKTAFKEIYIPSLITLGEGAFTESGVKFVTFEGVINNIERRTFESCYNLISIFNLGYLNAISDGMFRGCEYLESVDTTGNITTIGTAAFDGCVSLREVTIGESVQRIGDRAFAETENLVEVNYNAIQAEVRGRMIFNNAGLNYGMRVNIGTDVSVVPSYMFYSDYEEVYIHTIDFTGSTCQFLEGYNFDGSILRDVYITSALRTTGDYVFVNLPTLTPHTDRIFHYENSMSYWNQYLFSGISSYTNDYFSSYEFWTFNAVPENTTFESYASGFVIKDVIEDHLYGEIRLPSVWATDHDGTFSPVIGIRNRALSNLGSSSPVDVIIPKSIQYLEEEILYNSNVENLTFQSPMPSCEVGTFGSCAINNVVFDAQMDDWWHNSQFGNAGLNIFSYLGGQFYVRDKMFDLVNPVDLVTPSDIRVVYDYLFEWATQFETIHITENIRMIKNFAFSTMTVRRIYISDGLKTIQDYAFCDNGYLETITLPNTISYLGYGVFNNCVNLTEIFYDGTYEEYARITKDNFLGNATSVIYVRDANGDYVLLDDVANASFEIIEETKTEVENYKVKNEITKSGANNGTAQSEIVEIYNLTYEVQKTEEVTINEICDFTAVDANKSNDSSKNQDDDGEEEE